MHLNAHSVMFLFYLPVVSQHNEYTKNCPVWAENRIYVYETGIVIRVYYLNRLDFHDSKAKFVQT